MKRHGMILDPANAISLEVCVTSPAFAVAAERAEADRIELCTDLECGGLTPGVALMKAAREQVRIPIHVLIRPRAGGFVYSAREFLAMCTAIQTAKKLKMDGIVVGVLDRESRIDVDRTRELVGVAHPLPVTFHRAFDQTRSLEDSLEAVVETGAARLLTSGGRAKATDALSMIARLVKLAGDRLSVMPGSGITPANVARVIRATSAREVHGALLTPALRPEKVGAERSAQTERYYRRVVKVVSTLRSIATS